VVSVLWTEGYDVSVVGEVVEPVISLGFALVGDFIDGSFDLGVASCVVVLDRLQVAA